MKPTRTSPQEHVSRLSARDFERFWGFVENHDDPEKCWFWKSSIRKDSGKGVFGYTFGKRKSTVLVEVLAWFLIYGHAKEKDDIFGACGNPNCVNPRHAKKGVKKQRVIAKSLSLLRLEKLVEATGKLYLLPVKEKKYVLRKKVV